ncbi:hypothetical protein RHMOL_Rhmol09G0071300 [Rhododendron molle]|uniref:Uncharacterized protein n=1 Tax=Rhododendron molle TaxID=49168 RepID=A0ACC0MBC7_RHOML|nr:hypothetical protein RHMOL_Rhmol09G0071300 [Rhododendron molle]
MARLCCKKDGDWGAYQLGSLIYVLLVSLEMQIELTLRRRGLKMTADDISDGTPNRNKAAISEERHGTSDNMDGNSEEKGHHKPQDDISDGNPNTNKAAFSEERHDTSDKMDVSSEEKGHYIPQDGACNDSSLEGLSLSAGRTRDRSSSEMKSKLKGDPKSVKPVEYEENRLACGSSGENNMRNAAISGKRTSGRRSTSIPSAVGHQPTDCGTVDGNIARQAGKQSQNTSKTLGSCVGLSDANQIDDLKIAGSKKETNVKDASKSRKKTKRKLTYVSKLFSEILHHLNCFFLLDIWMLILLTGE